MAKLELTKPMKRRLLFASPLFLLLLMYITGVFLRIATSIKEYGIGTFANITITDYFDPILAVWAIVGYKVGRITFLIVLVVLVVAVVLFRWRDKALNLVDYVDERGVGFAKRGTYGIARPLKETEVEAATADFELGPIEKIDGYILGRLDNDNQKVGFIKKDVIDNSTIKGRPGKRTVAVKRQRRGNYNILVVGGSGSGKSAGFVRANILQAVKAGESVIVTDPVGELYTSFYKTLTEKGVECKVFNLANPEFSDSWACLDEILDPVTKEPSEERVTDFATIIIENTGGQSKDPIHSDGQKQLLSSMIHALAYTVKMRTAEEYVLLLDEMVMSESLPMSKKWIEWARRQLNPYCVITSKEKQDIIQKAMGKCTWDDEYKEKAWKAHMESVPELSLATIYHMLASHNKDTLSLIIEGDGKDFKKLPEAHPGRIAFHFFDNQNEKLKDGMLGGLGTRLQLLQSQNIRRILRNKDINLADAGDHQVVWFVIIPDQTTSTRAISSLFFNFLFVDNAAMADEKGAKNRKRINFIMDEFANIGVIPNIDKKINIARGRNFSLCVILQDILQLDGVYGPELAPIIISGCNTVLFLGSSNKETCQFFSEMSGEATIAVNTVRNSRGVGRVEPLAKEYQESMGEGKRYVYTEQEVRTLPNEECLIWVSGYNVLRAKKFWWFTHPGSRTADGKDLPESSPKDRMLAAEKYAETERRDAFLANDRTVIIESETEPDTEDKADSGTEAAQEVQNQIPDRTPHAKPKPPKEAPRTLLARINMRIKGKSCPAAIYSDGTAVMGTGEVIALNPAQFEKLKTQIEVARAGAARKVKLETDSKPAAKTAVLQPAPTPPLRREEPVKEEPPKQAPAPVEKPKPQAVAPAAPKPAPKLEPVPVPKTVSKPEPAPEPEPMPVRQEHDTVADIPLAEYLGPPSKPKDDDILPPQSVQQLPIDGTELPPVKTAGKINLGGIEGTSTKRRSGRKGPTRKSRLGADAQKGMAALSDIMDE